MEYTLALFIAKSFTLPAMQSSQSGLIEKAISFVKVTLEGAEGGHDWFHIERVWKNAKIIAKDEDCDVELVELAALLHDIADAKFHDGNESLGPQIAENFLVQNNVPKAKIEHIVAIIANMSFKNSFGSVKFDSPEFRIVQDADRLDAIGAIGIARAFNYGGFKNRALYDPDVPPNLNMTKEEYKKSSAPTINHFYEKLLLLKDRMQTKKGREMAEKRHQFMLDYLKEFKSEWM